MPVASKVITRLALAAVSMPAGNPLLVPSRDRVSVALTDGFAFSGSLETEIEIELSTSTCALGFRNLLLQWIGLGRACS